MHGAEPFKGEDEPFVMEMPKYRLPSLKLLWFVVYSKSLMYIKKAGTFILMASMLIWFISSYPKNSLIEEEYASKIEVLQSQLEGPTLSEPTEANEATTEVQAPKEPASIEDAIAALENEKHERLVEQTYLGIMGKAIEPAFAPLGFDWKMGVATISGLAAKEVIVSTLGVLYALGDKVTEEDTSLRDIIASNISFASAMAFIVFVMVYLPCLAATAVFAKEAE